LKRFGGNGAVHRPKKIMASKLSDDDSRAVDLVLDRSSAASQPAPAGVYMAPQVQPRRAQAVEKILAVLSAYQAEEPPADLVARTMRRIDERIEVAPGAGLAQQISAQQPLI